MPRFHPTNAIVILPRLEIEYSETLNEVLKTMGMRIAFTPDADFSALSPCKMWISRVIHKTYLKVDEEGSEAASVAVVEMKRGGTHKLVFDRPFFFAVRDRRTDSLLLAGSILEP